MNNVRTRYHWCGWCARFSPILFYLTFTRIIMEHPIKISGIAPRTIGAQQARAAVQSLHRKLDRLKEREAIRAALPQAFGDEITTTRGGTYGVSSTITLSRSLTQAATIGYTALKDGFQPTDLKQAAALVPELFTVVANYPTMRLEIGELDTEDGIELAGEFVNLTRIVTTALANSDPEDDTITRLYGERGAAQAITPQAALETARQQALQTPQAAFDAARLSLTSLRDVIRIGFAALRDGFSVLDVPALVGMFPDATRLAENAPLALQGWKQLTKQQRKDLGKLAVEIVADIWDTLEAGTKVAA
jgi:hypothetical protein